MKYKAILSFARHMRQNPTKAEQFFWEKVRRKQFLGKKFYRQYIIEHAEIQGRKAFFIADFYCHDGKLIVELDGKIHEEQVEYDRLREATLLDMGFSILRFPNEKVLNNWSQVSEELEAFFHPPPNSPDPS